LTGYGGIVRLKKSSRNQSHLFTEQLEKDAADIEANIAHEIEKTNTFWQYLPHRRTPLWLPVRACRRANFLSQACGWRIVVLPMIP
jgi:hypothetical protein